MLSEIRSFVCRPHASTIMHTAQDAYSYRFSPGFLPFGLISSSLHRVNKDFIWSAWSIGRSALAPVVATGVGKHVSRRIETGTRNGAIDGFKALESLLIVLVPEGNDSFA